VKIDQVKSVRMQCDVLISAGATEVVHGICPECGTVVLADSEPQQALCAYCGYGPFRVSML
jgi:ribosomal protein S27AE